jgi:uncharacterized protein YfaS (alpha-2-macroglobulin family)
MSIQIFQQGDTVCMWAYFKDWDGNYTSPDQGVKVTATDPDGTDQVDAQTMNESDTGQFVYYYTTDSDDVTGYWSFKCTGQDGTGASAKYSVAYGSFELK